MKDRPGLGRILLWARRHALAWLLLAMLLGQYPIPSAPEPFDPHRVSFCIGPALYRYGEDLLPCRDLFSQYGVGQGFVFGFFLADTAEATVDNFFVLHLVVVLGFFVLAYHCLAWVLGGRTWALFVCTVAI